MLPTRPRSPERPAPSILEALIEEARRRARRRRVGYGIAAALAAAALLAGLLSFIGNGGGGPPGTNGHSAKGPGAGPPGIHNQGGPNTKEATLGRRSKEFLRTVALPPSSVPKV